MKGKECPTHDCNKRWLWDWCLDSYRNAETGEVCKEVDIGKEPIEEPQETRTVTLFKCDCDTVLSIQVVDNYGGMIYNHPDWESTDWENEGYSWGQEE